MLRQKFDSYVSTIDDMTDLDKIATKQVCKPCMQIKNKKKHMVRDSLAEDNIRKMYGKNTTLFGDGTKKLKF